MSADERRNVRVYDRPPRLPAWAIGFIILLGVIAAALSIYWLAT